LLLLAIAESSLSIYRDGIPAEETC
jgi:hypothetical protein